MQLRALANIYRAFEEIKKLLACKLAIIIIRVIR